MSTTSISTKAKTIAISAVVTRANSKVENLGLISYRSTSLVKQWLYELGKRLWIFRR